MILLSDTILVGIRCQSDALANPSTSRARYLIGCEGVAMTVPMLFEHIDTLTAALAAERALADDLAAELADGLFDDDVCWNCGSKPDQPHHPNCPPAQALARHRAARAATGGE